MFPMEIVWYTIAAINLPTFLAFYVVNPHYSKTSGCEYADFMRFICDIKINTPALFLPFVVVQREV